jgi:precorrin-6B methylase 2
MKAFGEQYLAAGRSDVLFDLGMGAGKVAVQAFVQFRNLKYVYGVELSLGRYM